MPLGDDADVTAIVVTYNSADAIGPLIASLRVEAADNRLRVVVVDNASHDATTLEVAVHDDVVLVDAGGNLGYAAAINTAMEHVAPSRAVLVLNPDATVTPGCIATLSAALDIPGVVAAVPRILDVDGTVAHSLRREPALAATAVDAVLGSFLPHRPAWSSETVRDALSYSTVHDVEWATGAAVMVRSDVAQDVGEWDERFFLYSEETDYFRRLRAQGRVLFVPDATVIHTGAGSGTNQALADLLTINKIRYAEKYHGRAWSSLFRALVAASEVARSYSVSHRRTLRVVLDRGRWIHLPRGDRREELRRAGMGTVIVPAHNEAAVIGRTLGPLVDLAQQGVVEVIVVCNGCTDDTAFIARRFAGITVLEIDTPSKTAAMNAGDDAALFWPRIYLDADIVMTSATAIDVLTALDAPGSLSGRPTFVYDTTHSSFLVRRYYCARSTITEFSRHLWGAGCYAMTEEGHRRIGRFPDVIADDVAVDAAFDASEKQFVSTDPVIVAAPRTTRALVSILARNYRGNAETERTTAGGSSLRELVRSVRGPVTAVNAAVYVGLAVAGRRAARRHTGWARDESSRV